MKKCEQSVKLQKRQEFTKDFYNPQEAATLLKKSKRSILNWCESGEIKFAIPQPYGNQGKVTYLIPKASLELFKQERKAKKALVSESPITLTTKKHENLLAMFKLQLEDGFERRTYSPITIEYYEWHLKRYFEHYDYLTADNLELFFMRPELRKSQPQREKMHRAAVCFAKFLIRRHILDESELAEIQRLKPPAKKPGTLNQPVVTKEEVMTLLEYSKKNATVLNYAILCTFLGSGIRAQELCDIELSKLDVEKQEMEIKRKGGAYEVIGFNKLAQTAIKMWLEVRPHYVARHPEQNNLPWLFLSNKGIKLRRDCARERMVKMAANIRNDKGKLTPIHATPHALRAGYATINLTKGESASLVQKSLGHSRSETTQIYNRTKRNVVVEFMKSVEY